MGEANVARQAKDAADAGRLRQVLARACGFSGCVQHKNPCRNANRLALMGLRQRGCLMNASNAVA
jgi:hypothetical protein